MKAALLALLGAAAVMILGAKAALDCGELRNLEQDLIGPAKVSVAVRAAEGPRPIPAVAFAALNDHTYAFGNRSYEYVWSFEATGLNAADFDGDGMEDVVATHKPSGTIAVFRSNATVENPLNFSLAYNFSVPDGRTLLTSAMFVRDSDTNEVFVRFFAQALSAPTTKIGICDFNFTTATPACSDRDFFGISPSNPLSFVSRGHAGALFGSSGSTLTGVFFTSTNDLKWEQQASVNPVPGGSGVAICDFTGNGGLYVAAVNPSIGQLFLFNWSSGFEFDKKASLSSPNTTLSCVSGLFQDPSVEALLVCPGVSSDSYLCDLLSYDEGWVRAPFLNGTSDTVGVGPAVADFDADGIPDVLIPYFALSSGVAATYFFNVSCGGSSSPVKVSSSASEEKEPDQRSFTPFPDSIYSEGGSSSTEALSDASRDRSSVSRGIIALIVIGSVLVVGAAVGAGFFFLLGGFRRRKNSVDGNRESGPASSMALESLLDGETALRGLRRVDIDNARNIGLSLEPAELSFGSSSVPLEVGKDYHEKLTLATTGSKRLVVHLVPPRADPSRFVMSIQQGQKTLARDKPESIDVVLRLACTTTVSLELAIIVEGKNAYTVVPVRAQSQLSTKLDFSEMTFGDVLGVGSYGTVYRGMWRGQSVALKSFNESVFQNEFLFRDVEREIAMGTALRHPNVITFFGTAVQPDRFRMVLVMELADLGSLGGIVKAGPLPPRFKIRALLDVARGMAFLHTNSIVHRDLKPDNVLCASIDPSAPVCCKLSDFNTSRFLGSDPMKTKTKGVGTPIFLSPELIDGKNYDSSTDVFSFAMLAWNVWTQQTPYDTPDFASQINIFRFVLEGQRLPLPDGTPNGVKAIITAAWAQEPAARPPFATLVPQLEAALAATP